MRQGCLAWMAAVALSAAVTGCTQLEVERQLPDGSLQRYRFVAFKPSIEIRPHEFRIVPDGYTDHGYPIDRLIPIAGGRTLYRVTPPMGAPLFFEPEPARKPVDERELRQLHVRDPELWPAPQPGIKSGVVARYRVHADLFLDQARLDRSWDGGIGWQVLRAGSVSQVALEAAEHGIRDADFADATGSWAVQVDARFPLVSVWLDEALVQVQSIGP
jgi:hypothetical protein